MITDRAVEELIVMKSIARNAWLGAAALAVAAACAITIASESGLATAKPPPGCSKSSSCAGASGTTGANSNAGTAGTSGANGKAQGSRLVTTIAGQVTTVPGQVTTIPGTPIDETLTQGAPFPVGIELTCENQAGCVYRDGNAFNTQQFGTTFGFAVPGVVCWNGCVFFDGVDSPPTTVTGSPTFITGPPTTETQEGSANGGRTVSQVGTSAPSTVTGHH